MITNYFKIMVRHLLKNKIYLTINLIGLTVALACTILSVSFSLKELSFDTFHNKADNIYRLAKKNVNQTTKEESYDAETSGMMGLTMLEEFPEVTSCVRIQPWWDEVLISYGEKSFKASPWVFADSSFFSVFDFKLLRGDPQSVLVNPSSIVLTESLAKKLFGDEDPIGSSVIGLEDIDYQVTGIVADPPENSHIKFGALISWSTTVPGVGPLEYTFMNNWLGQTIYTYLLLENKADYEQLQSKFVDFMKRNFPERAENYFLFLQPLKKVYLNSANFLWSRFPMGSMRLLTIFLAISLIVLLIACFNYVNINTAKATLRSPEVGIRKVVGANKSQLVVQFLSESFMVTFVSLFLAVFIVDLFLPFFNELTGSTMTISDLLTLPVILIMVTLFLLVGLLAGIYPAFLLSGMKPSGMLRPSLNHLAGSKLRQILTFLQFTVSIAMITISLIVIRQYNFLRNYDTGFEKDKVLVIDTDNSIAGSPDAFRNELLKNPDIRQVSICQAAIGTGTFGSTVIPTGMSEEMGAQIFRIDKNFLDTYQMQLSAGRWFDSDLDTGFSIVVNETFVKKAGWDDPLQMGIKNENTPPTPIIGVVKDFNYLPLNQVKVDPILMYIDNRKPNASVRISGQNIPETISFIENTYKQFEKRHPFDYYFIDQWFDQQYKAQNRFLKIISLFTGISIILACLGLYGLTAFTISRRLKEIGIRKVLGASISNILFIVNKKFILLLTCAILIASPLAYILGEKWLSDFPYRVKIDPLLFIGSAVVALFISILAVSIQSLRAAVINPSKILNQD